MSHGLSGTNDGRSYLGEHLASHGYAVVSLEHAGSDFDATNQVRLDYLEEALPTTGLFSAEEASAVASRLGDGSLSLAAFSREVINRGGTTEDLKQLMQGAKSAVIDTVFYNNPEEWANRPKDVSFMLDELEQLTATNPRAAEMFDLSKVAVEGHSYGAYTSLAVAGAEVATADGGKTTYGDPRVDLVIAASPQGASSRFAFSSEEAWENIQIPVLMLAGENELAQQAEYNPDWRLEPYLGMPGGRGDKHVIVINDGEHNDFDDKGTPLGQGLMKGVGLTFLNAHLKSSIADQAALMRVPEGVNTVQGNVWAKK